MACKAAHEFMLPGQGGRWSTGCQQPACLPYRLQGASKEMDEAKVEARQAAMQNMRLKDDTARAQQNSQDLLVENARSAMLLDAQDVFTRLMVLPMFAVVTMLRQSGHVAQLSAPHPCVCLWLLSTNHGAQRGNHPAASASAAATCAPLKP